METATPHIERSTSWWITSLAISVTCCAIMFVVFAGYVADLRRDLTVQNVKIDELSQQQSILMSEVDALRHGSIDNGTSQPSMDSIVPKSDVPDSVPGTMPQQPDEVPNQIAPSGTSSKP